MHVMVDGEGRKEGWTEALVEEWLGRVVTHSGMLALAGPRVKQFQGHIYGGVTIEGGHIKALLDGERGMAWLEMFSCKWFSVPEFVKLCREAFELEGPLRIQEVERGLGG